LLVDEVESDLGWSGSNVVAGILVTQTTSVPPGGERRRGWPVSIECLEKRQSFGV